MAVTTRNQRAAAIQFDRPFAPIFSNPAGGITSKAQREQLAFKYPGMCCCMPCPVVITCCPVGLPSVLHGTVTNRTGTCSCIPDTLTFVWDGVILYRSQTFACDAGDMTFTLRCRAGAIDCTGIGLVSSECPTMVSVNPQTGCVCDNCNLVDLKYIGVAPTVCCTGTFDVEVTN